jgi:hypothetical protein
VSFGQSGFSKVSLSEVDDLFQFIVSTVDRPVQVTLSLPNGLGGNIEPSTFLR